MALDEPEIVVVGAGAMGGLFGGLLAEGGLSVTLVDAWAEHVAAIDNGGLRMVGVGGDRRIKVRATTDARTIERADVVLFQCKAYHNEAAAAGTRHLFGKDKPTVAISFQNGVGNEGAVTSALQVVERLSAERDAAARTETVASDPQRA
jgi:2-dehydropantoate 2-reductase